MVPGGNRAWSNELDDETDREGVAGEARVGSTDEGGAGAPQDPQKRTPTASSALHW
jgi:hypothetical protein